MRWGNKHWKRSKKAAGLSGATSKITDSSVRLAQNSMSNSRKSPLMSFLNVMFHPFQFQFVYSQPIRSEAKKVGPEHLAFAVVSPKREMREMPQYNRHANFFDIREDTPL